MINTKKAVRSFLRLDLSIAILAMIITLPEIRAELYQVDKIQCVVCGPIKNTPLTETDESHKRDMNGQPVPLSQQIQNDIVSQQIVADKVPVDPSAADKYVETLKKQNNLTDTDLAEMFEQIGRTYVEGLSLLNEQYCNEMFMHHKFKSQQVATDEDVLKYYEEHPVYTDGKAEIQVAYVDFDDNTKVKMQKAVDKIVKGQKPTSLTVQWSSPITVALRDIAEDKKFIFDMNPEQITSHEGHGSFELYKLISKQEPAMKTLEELRSTIVEKLNRTKLESMLEDYNQEVRKFIDIINLTDQ